MTKQIQAETVDCGMTEEPLGSFLIEGANNATTLDQEQEAQTDKQNSDQAEADYASKPITMTSHKRKETGMRQ